MSCCPNCSYKLVLLSSRPKYKCALCSGLYPEKEIEVKEFQKLNKRLRIEDIENYEKERKEHFTTIRKVKHDLRLLFNGFPKTNKIDKEAYYQKNKEKIRQLSREWRLRNREYDLKRKIEYGKENRKIRNLKARLRRQDSLQQERERKKAWRNNKLPTMKTYGMIQHYRTKQKALALQYLKNDTYSLSNNNPFSSVPTFELS